MALPAVVATDLDGTLLRSDQRVSDRTLTVLARLAAAGCHLVLVTGRPIRWLEPVLDQTGRQGMAVGGNGAYVLDGASGGMLGEWPMTPAALRAATTALREAVPEAVFAVERRSAFVAELGYPLRAGLADRQPFGQLVADSAYKLLARAPEVEPAVLYDAAVKALDGIVTPTWSSSGGLVEMSALGVTKASGLAWVTDRLGVAAADVLAFGDMPNDVPMLAWAGRAVAVGNAHPDVVAVADEVTGTNEDDGVAAYVENLLNG